MVQKSVTLNDLERRNSRYFALLTGNVARSAKRRLLSYSEADFQVFRPHGWHVAPAGVKFGMEEGTFGPLLYAKLHPHRCNNKGIGPPKLKFFFRDLIKMQNINAPQEHIPCTIFTIFAEFVRRFMMR